jgi:hypothetical protein
VTITSPEAPITGRFDDLLADVPRPVGDGVRKVIIDVAPYGQDPPGRANATYCVSIDGDRSAAQYGWLSACEDWLLAEFTRWVLDDESDRVHLHAGLVERRGAGLMLVGPSGCGKSTLTAHLVRRGWSYHTDEMVGLDLDAPTTASCFSRPIALKPGSWPWFSELPSVRSASLLVPRLERVHVPTSELGASRGRDGSRIGAVVFLGHPGAGGELVRVGPSEAVELLTMDALDLGRAGAAGMAALVELARHAHLVKLVVRDLDRAETLLSTLLDETLTRPREAMALGIRPGARPRPSGVLAPVDADAVVVPDDDVIGWLLEDGCVVYGLEGGVLVRLDPSGAEAWQGLDGRTTIGGLARRLGVDPTGLALWASRLDEAHVAHVVRARRIEGAHDA